MKIVITGASGFVGKRLVPFLHNKDFKLLLVGRNASSLAEQYSYAATTDYESLDSKLKGYDAIIHLATNNNDQSGTIEDFQHVNVDLLQEIAKLALKHKVKVFINLSSLHSLTASHKDSYSQSKRQGELLLSYISKLKVIQLRLPAIYNENFRGNLSILNYVPSSLRKSIFLCLSALKSTVHTSKICEKIFEILKNVPAKSTEILVTDRQFDNPVYHVIKRAMDISFVIFVIVFFGWLLLASWIAIKLNSPGSAIFKQTRVGLGGKRFVCYKLRTMKHGTIQASTHEICKDSVTSVGKFLRRTGIDELPQLWNILRNEMSLIGPRPCLPIQTAVIEEREALGVYKVKPGISGLAQISNINMSEPLRIARYDANYIHLQCLLIDVKIILKTILISFRS
ncbi:MAG: sugar transferase [Mariprofundaceae bacterium]|nr:sugar transferase [Mariprofundaceae bacterium]